MHVVTTDSEEKSYLRATGITGICAWVKRTADMELKEILRAYSCNPGTHKSGDIIGSFAYFL